MFALLRSLLPGVLLLAILPVAPSPGLGQTIQLNGNDILRSQGMLNSGKSGAAPSPKPEAATTQATGSGSAAPAPAPSSVASNPRAGIAPIAIFLYPEAFSCRLEVMLRATDFFQMTGISKPAQEPWNLQARQGVESQANGLAGNWVVMATERGNAEGRMSGATLVRGTPGATLPLEDKDLLPPAEAWVGLTWEFATHALPEEFTLQWKGPRPATLKEIPLKVFHAAGTQAETLALSREKWFWRSKGRIARPKPLAEVPAPEADSSVEIPMAMLLWIAAGFLALLNFRRSGKPWIRLSPSWLVGWSLGLLLTYPLLHVKFGGDAKGLCPTSKEEAQRVIAPLLRNVYQAFDRRDEEGIYDVLALSVEGDLLRQLYLETIAALSLDGREGARVTVKEFTTTVESVTPSARGWQAQCQWTALGSVGHWGHQHTRINRYKAGLTVEPIGKAWKITQLKIAEARRL